MSTRKDRARQRSKGRTVLVRPLVSAWMLKNADKPFTDEAVSLAEEILRRNDGKSRKGLFSPSQGDKCMRASVMKFFGYPDRKVDSFATLNLFRDGNYGHLMWQMIMWDMGILERAEFEVQVQKWGVAGTCDGVIAVPDFSKVEGGYDPRMTRQDVRDIVESGSVKTTRLIAEIKRQNEYRWGLQQSSGEPEAGILWQGGLYYYGAREVLPPEEAERLKGVCYWLENKNNNGILEFNLAPTKAGLIAFQDFYGEALEYAKASKLPDRVDVKGSRTCNMCWQRHRCDEWTEKGRTEIAPWKKFQFGEFTTEALKNV